MVRSLDRPDDGKTCHAPGSVSPRNLFTFDAQRSSQRIGAIDREYLVTHHEISKVLFTSPGSNPGLAFSRIDQVHPRTENPALGGPG